MDDWDPRGALEMLDGDEQLLAELGRKFLDGSDNVLDTLRAALAAGDAVGVAQTAHRLKGSCGYFAAADCLPLLRQIETAAREGDLARAAGGLPELVRCLESLRSGLERYLRGARE